MLICWLVVSNMTFIFHNIWDVILPIDELIFFKMVSQPPTSIFLEVFFGELPTKAKHQPQRARNPSSCTCPNFCTEPGCWALPQPQKCPEFWRCWWLSMFFFRRNLRWAKMFVVKIGGIRVSSALNLKEQLLYACVSRQHTLLPCAGSTFIHSYLRHVRRHPKPSARSAVGIKKTPGTIFWYPMELGKSSTLRGHTLW